MRFKRALGVFGTVPAGFTWNKVRKPQHAAVSRTSGIRLIPLLCISRYAKIKG